MYITIIRNWCFGCSMKLHKAWTPVPPTISNWNGTFQSYFVTVKVQYLAICHTDYALKLHYSPSLLTRVSSHKTSTASLCGRWMSGLITLSLASKLSTRTPRDHIVQIIWFHLLSGKPSALCFRQKTGSHKGIRSSPWYKEICTS